MAFFYPFGSNLHISSHVRSSTIWSDTTISDITWRSWFWLWQHNKIWTIKILHNLTSHDGIWHNVMILILIQQPNMIWHIKILHNAQVSQSLEQKSDSFTDKSFRAHTRRTMHTTIGEGDETRPHICHIYHRLYLWRKFCHVEKFQISVKNLNNLWSFIKIYAVFVLNLCGEKYVWRKPL